MKKYVYCLRDKKLGAYDNPVFLTEDPEHYAEGVARSLKRVDDPQVYVKARDMALYYLGKFDDVSGVFELPVAEKLIDYEDYLPQKEEVLKNVKADSRKA